MPEMDNDPLLDFSGLPRFADFEIDHIEPCLESLIRRNREAIEALATAGGEATWDDFAAPMEQLDEDLERFWSPVSHLNAVRDSEALRGAYERCLPLLSEYATDVGQDSRLLDKYRQIRDGRGFAALSDAQKRIVDNAIRDFRLSGVDLEPEAKRRFKAIQSRLSELSNQFSRNLLDATQGWILNVENESELAGLPDSVRAMAKQNAADRELRGWVFTLDAPSFIPFMTYADDGELRRRMYEAYVTRASDRGPDAGRWDNTALIRETLELRREAASILGFSSYAEYSLQTKMAESPAAVETFITDLARRSRSMAAAELEELREFARSHHGVSDLNAWDLGYFAEKLRRHRFDFSDEDVRPYFPVDQVLKGMFEVTGRIFSIRVKPAEPPQLWHEDVGFFEIEDDDGKALGQFYVDLYARSGKRGGAWMGDCISRKKTGDGVQLPVAFLVCNFTPPVDGEPALLTHEEVTTLFHEFGHGLHHMLTRVDYVGVSGIAGVAWDAVELPSQFLENWCWEREALDIVAGHHRSGEPIPDELLRKMRKARNFQSAMQMLRQLEFALFDLRLHCTDQLVTDDLAQRMIDIVRAEVAVVIPPQWNRFQNGFSHIFAGGYAAGYYSYKWAEVLSADAFSLFEENGIFDVETGLSFRRQILEKGGTYEPMDLFKAFRGREPDPAALLRHSGIAA